jgi:hypothetical protein
MLNIKNLKNTADQPMIVRYAFDKRKVIEGGWSGVVLRNLPPDTNPEIMKKNFGDPNKNDSTKVINFEVP